MRSCATQADGLWPWAKNHSFHSWRDRYITNKPRFDRMIEKHIRNKANAVKQEDTGAQSQPRRSSQPPKRGTPTGRGRRVQKAKVYSQPKTAFTEDEKYLLAQYLAEVHPEKKGRLGFGAYTALMENVRVTVLVFVIMLTRFYWLTERKISLGPEAYLVIVAWKV